MGDNDSQTKNLKVQESTWERVHTRKIKKRHKSVSVTIDEALDCAEGVS